MEKQQSKSGIALAGVIVGAVAVALSAIPIINNFAFVLAVLALIFGIVGLIQTSKGKRGGRGRAVAAVIVAIVALAIVIISQSIYGAALDKASKELGKTSAEIQDNSDKVSGKKTDQLLKNDVGIELGKFNVTTDQYGLNSTELSVSVTNKNADKKSYSVQIEAVDASGNRLDEGTVYANDLGPNQSQVLKTFQYVPSDKVEALKSATFKVVTISQS
jgi:type III secretory pathway component EscV